MILRITFRSPAFRRSITKILRFLGNIAESAIIQRSLVVPENMLVVRRASGPHTFDILAFRERYETAMGAKTRLTDETCSIERDNAYLCLSLSMLLNLSGDTFYKKAHHQRKQLGCRVCGSPRTRGINMMAMLAGVMTCKYVFVPLPHHSFF